MINYVYAYYDYYYYYDELRYISVLFHWTVLHLKAITMITMSQSN